MADMQKITDIMMAAFVAIAKGETDLETLIPDSHDLGRQTRLGRALENGQMRMDDFTDHEMEIVDAAFAELGEPAPSRVPAECCNSALSLLYSRR